MLVDNSLHKSIQILTNSSRYVLGVHSLFHDGAAALLRNGELVAMVEQERLSRRRHAIGEPPSEAIAACLAQAGIGLSEVREIAVGVDIPEAIENNLTEGTLGKRFDEGAFAAWLLGYNLAAGEGAPPLRFVNHHLAHAASGFYTSGFSEAAILVVDGRGETAATTIAAGGPGGIETLQSWGVNLSLGHLYGTAASWAGLSQWGAGKLMGLAAYGRPRQPVPLVALADGGYTISGAPPADSPVRYHLPRLEQGIMDEFAARNYPFGPGSPPDVMAHADFAASIQHALEEVLLGLAATARRESGSKNLVVTGGVGANCSANGVLIRSGMFDEVWIPPFPYDAGASVGAALIADRAISDSPRPAARLPHAFWAPDTGGLPAQALTELAAECEVNRLADAELADAVARHLQDGKLVGWWQGRAEVGQRALGARSILCDPRERRSLVRANEIKGREGWRPLAPAVLDDHAAEVFDGTLPIAADFMLAAWPVRESARQRLTAAVHVDGSARPQTVRPQQRRYRAVIEAFAERTGIPAVINTSFNLAGEPIVLSPEDAVDTFLRSGLDVLVVDDLVVCKTAGTPRRATAAVRPESGNDGSQGAPSWLKDADTRPEGRRS